MRSAIIAIVVVILIGAGVLYFANQGVPEQPAPSDEIPAPSATYTNATSDNIVVDMPQPGASIPRTIIVSGSARGNWYFEASFPVEVIDQNGAVLLQTYMEAQGEWMTTEFVSFSKSITIPGSYTGAATLILRKDNPSGLPEHDASVSLPIVIQP